MCVCVFLITKQHLIFLYKKRSFKIQIFYLLISHKYKVLINKKQKTEKLNHMS